MRCAMKIRYASDLHLEFPWSTPGFLPSIGEDVVVLAGDICVGTQGITWAAEAFAGRPVIYVLGNHEFYGYDFDELIPHARITAEATANVHLLENGWTDIDGVRFLGCTLWTDFDLYGTPQRSAAAAAEVMCDYRTIVRGYRGLTPDDVAARCRNSKDWLEERLRGSRRPTVVVTHMAPSGRKSLSNPKFPSDPLTPAFHNGHDVLIQDPVRAWIFGHHHHSLEEDFDGVRIVSNQRGYPGEGCDFDWERVVDLDMGALP